MQMKISAKMLKKISSLILALALIISLSACRGVVLDENEVIESNGSENVTKGGVKFSYSDGEITKDGERFVSIEGYEDNSLFALGEYLYVNTSEGVMQIRISDGKTKKFGSGVILAAKGRWIYYKSDLSKARGMSLYKIDMKEGREVLLFEGDPISAEENENVFTFKTADGKTYTNELSSDEAEEATE